MQQITLALSKGRILKESLPLLATAGINIDASELKSRKLILDTNNENIKVIILRPTDVPTFIQHGVADIGITGKDVLGEHGGKNIFELVDLGIAKCKLMVAGKSENDLNKDNLIIATKYTKSAHKYFSGRQNFELIKLYGAMELAPIVGMSDIIVDLVDTGNTLKANGLKPLEFIEDISSRLIVNSASFHTKKDTINQIVNNISKAL
jgi:ATP phosphoribosyltransferase